MNDHADSDIEKQLRADAAAILQSQDRASPVSEILQRHHGRMRRRKFVHGGSLMLIFVLAPAAWIASMVLHWPTGEVATKESTEITKSSGALLTDTPLAVADTTKQPLVDEPSVFPASVAQPSEDSRGRTNAVPMVLVRTDTDGKARFVPALYVPERSEPIDFRQLNKAQQRAVWAVLGKAKPPEMRNPI